MLSLHFKKAVVLCMLLPLVSESFSAVPRLSPFTKKKVEGYFKGEVKTEWLDPVKQGHPHGTHDRDMKLLSEFTFVDKKGHAWTAPKGCVVDGASIPRPFWPLVGSPYVVDFRRATVVHDYYCKHKTRRHQDVSQMFYEAMCADGLFPLKAFLIAAVVHFFNIWPDPTKVD